MYLIYQLLLFTIVRKLCIIHIFFQLFLPFLIKSLQKSMQISAAYFKPICKRHFLLFYAILTPLIQYVSPDNFIYEYMSHFKTVDSAKELQKLSTHLLIDGLAENVSYQI